MEILQRLPGGESGIAKRTVKDQISDKLAYMILTGLLRPGDELPSERQLAGTLGVARESVRAAIADADGLIMAAAVADFRPRRVAPTKLGRDTGLTLELEPTEDILAGVAAAVPPQGDPARPILVGFAAETGSLDRAAAKLRRKGVDFLVANDVAEEGSGFGTDTNHVRILAADGTQVDLPLRSKRAVADEILDLVAAALDGRDAAAQTARQTQETIA